MRRLAPPQRKTTLRRRLTLAAPAHSRAQDAWRTLVAVEMGMKNHEFVPAPLVDTIAGLRNGA
jgi:RIO-like serine/threonine protein kinase